MAAPGSADLDIALIGSGWISRQYAEAIRQVDGARLVAVASRGAQGAETLARDFDAPLRATFDTLDTLLADERIDVICVNSPNYLHAEHAIAALRAGKHVVIEKPMCMSYAEADAILAAARDSRRGVAYAENLVFAPRFVRARELIREGAIGRVRWARQVEKHGGPYSPWFWRAHEAGGGALADMGCHGIECLRWLLDKPPIRRVRAHLARLRHRDKTALDDDATVLMELDDDAYLVSESSWAVTTGMQSRLEVHGSEGSLEVDLLAGPGARLCRAGGEWEILEDPDCGDSGYVAQLKHFLDCFRSAREPEEGAADGRAVLEILLAAYASAARGTPIELPFDPGPVLRPVELWVRG